MYNPLTPTVAILVHL